MSEAKPAEGGGEAKKKPDLGKILPLIVAVINLTVVGGGAFLTFKATIGYHPPSLREPAAIEEVKAERESQDGAEPVLYAMETFNVNLAGSPRRMMRVQMSLEMLDKEGFEEVVTLGPAARDSIMRILNSKTYSDIETIQGKLFLKDQIAMTLNESLNEGVVKDIHFSEFLVQ